MSYSACTTQIGRVFNFIILIKRQERLFLKQTKFDV
jgi:hypothetical protein